jgi:hypothetical protein
MGGQSQRVMSVILETLDNLKSEILAFQSLSTKLKTLWDFKSLHEECFLNEGNLPFLLDPTNKQKRKKK